ncbi:MAG: hypothetical protein ACREDR_35430, partial [Blastocatellia bacterium]
DSCYPGGVIHGNLFGRSLPNKPSNEMALPHQKSRKDKQREEDISSRVSVLRKLFKRTKNIAVYRNA